MTLKKYSLASVVQNEIKANITLHVHTQPGQYVSQNNTTQKKTNKNNKVQDAVRMVLITLDLADHAVHT